jgi:hypothetical protein
VTKTDDAPEGGVFHFPINVLRDDSYVRRAELSSALAAAGFPIALATLNSLATRGGGPPYRMWGRFPIYRWADALAWARNRLSEPAHSSSEHVTQRAKLNAQAPLTSERATKPRKRKPASKPASANRKPARKPRTQEGARS